MEALDVRFTRTCALDFALHYLARGSRAPSLLVAAAAGSRIVILGCRAGAAGWLRAAGVEAINIKVFSYINLSMWGKVDCQKLFTAFLHSV